MGTIYKPKSVRVNYSNKYYILLLRFAIVCIPKVSAKVSMFPKELVIFYYNCSNYLFSSFYMVGAGVWFALSMIDTCDVDTSCRE